MTERLWATSHDGVRVPITLCRRRPVCPTGSSSNSSSSVSSGGQQQQQPGGPLLLQVHGAYGLDPGLEQQPALSALLRRGVAVAVAHVRGGGFLGPAW